MIGANGSGKTRLGVYIEESLPGQNIIRIPAHRSLTINDDIRATSFEKAKTSLHFGSDSDKNPANRKRHKYSNRPATYLLNDYEKLLQTLFSEQSNVAVQHLNAHRANPAKTAPETVLNRLKMIWMQVLPHRALYLRELSIQAYPPKQEGKYIQGLYAASEMSDGERVILYLIGQCLLAPNDAVVIVDEPELHVHKSLMSKLWDAIENSRQDCCFLYITHDLDFAVGRATALKYAIRSFEHPSTWEIEEVNEKEGVPERMFAELLGSRQPILFVEGNANSIDVATYRYCYPGFLIKPIGSCNAVIHAVSSLNANSGLHRVIAQGCIDADARDEGEIKRLQSMKIFVLPVAEVENVFLLPSIFFQLAKDLSFSADEATQMLETLQQRIFTQASNDIDEASVRFAIRRIDTQLKSIGPYAKVISDLETKLLASFQNINPVALAEDYKKNFFKRYQIVT